MSFTTAIRTLVTNTLTRTVANFIGDVLGELFSGIFNNEGKDVYDEGSGEPQPQTSNNSYDSPVLDITTTNGEWINNEGWVDKGFVDADQDCEKRGILFESTSSYSPTGKAFVAYLSYHDGKTNIRVDHHNSSAILNETAVKSEYINVNIYSSENIMQLYERLLEQNERSNRE